MDIFFDMLHTDMRCCVSGSLFDSPERHGSHNQNEFRNFSQETKEIAAILVPGVLLDSVNPLLCMWGGAVNRQPGYRARNLQRRGCLSTKSIPEATATFPNDT